jgi:hypothetical protein
MSPARRYRQLKLEINTLQDQYPDIILYFRINGKEVIGMLKGSVHDWTFYSSSAAFLKVVPGGKLKKYMLWTVRIPKGLSRLYNAIGEAAIKAGYDLEEKDNERAVTGQCSSLKGFTGF